MDEEFVGQVVTVVKSIAGGADGLVELKGAQWKAVSDLELMEGDRAEVVERDNLTLKVIPRR